MEPTDKIKIDSRKGWWRGMLIINDLIYAFASDGYRRKKTTIRMATINLKTGAKSKATTYPNNTECTSCSPSRINYFSLSQWTHFK